MLFPDEVESLTNIDGYFNTRLRPQNSVLSKYLKKEIETIRKISSQEPLPPKEIPVEKIKTNFIIRNDLLKYLGQEKALEAAEAFLSENFEVVRKFQDDFSNFFKINGEKCISKYDDVIQTKLLGGGAAYSYSSKHFNDFVKLIGSFII